jgi:hypothetical protein
MKITQLQIYLEYYCLASNTSDFRSANCDYAEAPSTRKLEVFEQIIWLVYFFVGFKSNE